MTNRGSQTITWDAENRSTSIISACTTVLTAAPQYNAEPISAALGLGAVIGDRPFGGQATVIEVSAVRQARYAVGTVNEPTLNDDRRCLN